VLEACHAVAPLVGDPAVLVHTERTTRRVVPVPLVEYCVDLWPGRILARPGTRKAGRVKRRNESCPDDGFSAPIRRTDEGVLSRLS
jgi:hypothetical protein